MTSVDILGRQFGRLTVINLAEKAGCRGRRTTWRCLCICGTESVVTTSSLISGRTKSCGCLKKRCGAENPHADLRPILDRLSEHSYTDLKTNCAVWTGHRLHFGHGMINILGRAALVHRAAWEEIKGLIPEGLDCLHRCDNPPCWNIDHLFLGTQADNNADRDAKGRQRAPLGEAHGRSKLTAEKVLAIRSDLRTDKQVARDFDVSPSNIRFVRSRITWRHVP